MAFATSVFAADAGRDDYYHWVDITVTNYTGTTTLADYPLMVKISETSLPRFKYADATAYGESDIRFYGSDGSLLSFECDTWNASGESIFWVKIPEFKNNISIRMCWMRQPHVSVPAVTASDVWTKYAGVWHMSETITSAQAATTFSHDSSAYANHATPTKGTSGDLTQMLSTPGQIGNGRVNSSSTSTKKGNRLRTENTASFDGVFTFSGWYKLHAIGASYPTLVANKTKLNAVSPGWVVVVWQDSSKKLTIKDSTASGKDLTIEDSLLNNWVYLTFVYNGTQAKVYSNGVQQGTDITISKVEDGSNCRLTFGADASDVGADNMEFSLNGSYDELRITGEALSADWIAADYAQMKTDAAFTSIGEVQTSDRIYSGIIQTGALVTWSEDPAIQKGEIIFKYWDVDNAGTLTIPKAVRAWVLAVGGGGAGGNTGNTQSSTRGRAGGGGAGGFVEVTNRLDAGTYTFTVGKGGVSPTAAGAGGNGSNTVVSVYGGSSIITAYGGGGGGRLSAGNSGGSGGGASLAAAERTGGEPIAGQGNKGGDGLLSGTQAGAGGGGAGGAGGNASSDNVGGDGGIGKASLISGSEVFYAGGGGGAAHTGGTAGQGGKGGGGAGSENSVGVNGTANTGGGGGGGAYNTNPGGAGGSGVVIIRIIQVMPDKPTAATFLYDGLEHTVFPETEGFVIEGTASATNAGTYTFKVTPKDGWGWADGTAASPSTESVTVTWSITKSQIALESFSQKGWQIGEERPTPITTATNVTTGASVDISSLVTYTYAETETGTYSEKTDSELTSSGDKTWYMIATVAEGESTSGFVSDPISFKVWRGSKISGVLDGVLAYHTDFTVANYSGAPLTNFPMVIRFSEASIAGLDYNLMEKDDIRFIDSGGNLISFEIDTWDTTGESVIWVKVPEYKAGAKVTMCWGAVEGATIPDAPEETVWDDYVGVWHMSETIDAETAATTLSTDSTTNSLHATPTKGANGDLTQMVSTSGVFGNGRVNAVYTDGNDVSAGNRLSAPSYDSQEVGDVFSFSGWYHMDEVLELMPCLVSRKSGHGGDGWEIKLWGEGEGRRKLAVYGGDGVTSESVVSDSSLRNNSYYTYVTAVYNGPMVTVYADGVRVSEFEIGSATDNGLEVAFGGAQYSDMNGTKPRTVTWYGSYDEIRIRRGVLSADWVYADYLQGAGAQNGSAKDSIPNYTVTPAIYDGKSRLRNHWIVLPGEVAGWVNGQSPEITDLGVAAYGKPFFVLRSLRDGASLTNSTAVTESGTYAIEFIVEPGKAENGHLSWGGLVYSRYVTVTSISPREDLSGTAGSATLSGRVLLANEDSARGISGQSYSHWTHLDETEIPSSYTPLLPNVKNGAEHILCVADPVVELCGSSNIWHLTDVYIGTIYTESDAPTVTADIPSRNRLPYAPSTAITPADAVYMIMRNKADAAIISPCYTNGIGTIYFDAVNGWKRGGTTNYTIVVEMAKGAVAELADVDAAAWTRVDMRPLKSTAGSFAAMAKTNELSLAADAGGDGVKDYYRVVVPVDCREPVRFRIRRETTATGFAEDTGGFILVDNVVVSYPAMRADISSYGHFDTDRGGKETLGYSGAWEDPFPSVGHTTRARGKASFYINPGDTNADVSAFITGVTMYYRWRYLDQRVAEWKTVRLNPKNLSNENFLLSSEDDLDFTSPVGENIAGDIEYWFESSLDAPYYNYVDYSVDPSASTAFKMTDFYTENFAKMTNAANSASIYESRGKDWFIRLREGTSPYEKMEIEYVQTRRGRSDEIEKAISNGTSRISMELTEDHVWRGLLPTLDATNLHFRIVGSNCQETNSLTWATNSTYWIIPTTVTNSWPISTTLVEGDSNSWFNMWSDARTGYLLFQMDDDSKAISLAHADYQSVNFWNDAKGSEFVGNSVDTNSVRMSGASPKARTFAQNFSGWKNMFANNNYWAEDFDKATATDLTLYKPQTMWETPMSWTAGPGMLVHGRYKGGSDYAYQMQGCGLGNISLMDMTFKPRGYETLKFDARLAQFISFEDFSRYIGAGANSMSNYTFTALSLFDLNANKNFRGNASISLVANYHPNRGCYEFRVEPVSTDDKIEKWTVKLSLYKWNKSGDATLLGSSNLDSKELVRSTSPAGSYNPIYISVSNLADRVYIMAGFGTNSGKGKSASFSEAGGWEIWRSVVYTDTTSTRLTKGTFGCLTANCEGVIQRPILYGQATPYPGEFTKLNTFDIYSNKTIVFPTAVAIDTKTILSANPEDCDDWSIPSGRMLPYKGALKGATDDTLYGLVATNEPQSVTISLAPVSGGEWKDVGRKVISDFGSSSNQASESIDLFTTEDSYIRISVDGDATDARRDVVIDNISFTQWRGANWQEMSTDEIPTWQSEALSRGHTNFVFSSAVITNECLLLSARRTSTNAVSSIRAPLMDGVNGRGYGLGMFSFSYKNAQTNTILHLQWTTNYYTDTMLQLDQPEYYGVWEDLATFDFTGPDVIDRAQGTRSFYVGKHGVQGVMRLVVDTNLVARLAASGETNRTAFGEITITSVTCRDEPALDERCWWGWNLRTIGADEESGEDTEKRMFLPDLTTTSSALPGLSLALNNSISNNVTDYAGQEADYKANLPFVQSPTFGTNLVGEVAFRARKYDLSESQPAQVTLFGSKTGDIYGVWTNLATFVIKDHFYKTYSYKTNPHDDYRAFRLAVVGVDGVTNHWMRGEIADGYTAPVRILLDELMVREAVRARVGFRKVGAFRTNLDNQLIVPGVPGEDEQPMCDETWGIQCEIFKAQLPNEIDFSREPRVRLHWFRGKYPWGYENWKDKTKDEGHYSTMLMLAEDSTDTNLVFRGSYPAGEATLISPDTVTDSPDGKVLPGTVVQYMLEVSYYQTNQTSRATDWLQASDWVIPEWYKPVDYNAASSDGAFAAYSILDTVAPHWAWINEVNLYGGEDSNGNGRDKKKQYVEIAVPAEADISGWYLEGLEIDTVNHLVKTNRLATFGHGRLGGRKKDNIGMASNKVFRVIASPLAETSGYLNYNAGTLDETWTFDNPWTAFNTDGTITAFYPVAFRLMRPSGIAEHEIVAYGYDLYEDATDYFKEYFSPTNTVNLLKSLTGEEFIYVGMDDNGEPTSLGVFDGRGETSNVWNNTMIKTPGRINDGQYIKSDHPTANGTSIIVFANLDTATGPITQTFGRSVNTNASVVVYVPKGSTEGTNITYTVGLWHILGSVTTNGSPIASTDWNISDKTYVVNVAKYASNNVTVVATPQLKSEISDAIPNADYRDAIIDWLNNGEDMYGNPWLNPAGEKVYPGEYISHWSKEKLKDMTLLDMYWLDIDPTITNQAVEIGFAAPSTPIVPGYLGSASVTNIQMQLFMSITNRDSGRVYAPYVIRGREIGSSSWDYSADSSWGWTNANLKIEGILANGRTSEMNPKSWVPLRWFVFQEGSFNPTNFISTIEVRDPLSVESPSGWYREVLQNGPSPVFYRWNFDTSLKPVTVEILKEDSTYQ